MTNTVIAVDSFMSLTTGIIVYFLGVHLNRSIGF